MSTTPRLPAVLLVEPQFVMRRTMVAVARELGLVDFHEVSSIARALPLLEARRFGGMVLDMDDGSDALTLLERLRAGQFVCRPDLPVVALTFPAGPGLAGQLEALRPLRTLHKPFKVGELLASVAMMSRH
ncbi:response regulator [Pseudorhodoferax sp.]|uniref:response regulator n=1 Tax=Pseudorhodoferax sp. TaxID=1993553 RepID=UPI002DD62C13|nr:response regulator [Pseudorhodoferax sp.]